MKTRTITTAQNTIVTNLLKLENTHSVELYLFANGDAYIRQCPLRIQDHAWVRIIGPHGADKFSHGSVSYHSHGIPALVAANNDSTIIYSSFFEKN